MCRGNPRAERAPRAVRPWAGRPRGPVQNETAATTHRRGLTLWARQDSNLRPSGYEPPALTAELQALASGGMRLGTGSANGPLLIPPERATGFEPANDGLEGRCLTPWRRPQRHFDYTRPRPRGQGSPGDVPGGMEPRIDADERQQGAVSRERGARGRGARRCARRGGGVACCAQGDATADRRG